jgi:hypothetical protein
MDGRDAFKKHFIKGKDLATPTARVALVAENLV